MNLWMFAHLLSLCKRRTSLSGSTHLWSWRHSVIPRQLSQGALLQCFESSVVPWLQMEQVIWLMTVLNYYLLLSCFVSESLCKFIEDLRPLMMIISSSGWVSNVYYLDAAAAGSFSNRRVVHKKGAGIVFPGCFDQSGIKISSLPQFSRMVFFVQRETIVRGRKRRGASFLEVKPSVNPSATQFLCTARIELVIATVLLIHRTLPVVFYHARWRPP